MKIKKSSRRIERIKNLDKIINDMQKLREDLEKEGIDDESKKKERKEHEIWGKLDTKLKRRKMKKEDNFFK